MTHRVAKVSATVLAAVVLWGSPALASHGNGKHWSGQGERTVRVIDRTGDAALQKKVRSAVAAWDSGATKVKLLYETGSGGCRLDQKRIEVCQGGKSFTKWSYDSNNHFLGVVVTLSPSMMRKAGDAIACHELGHALGLGHRPSGTSCMTATVSPSQTTPDGHDFATVDAQHHH